MKRNNNNTKSKASRQARAIDDTVRAMVRDENEKNAAYRRIHEARFRGNSHMSQAQMVVCLQTFAPWAAATLPYTVLPPRLKGVHTGALVPPPHRPDEWSSRVTQVTKASTTGVGALVLDLKDTGYNNNYDCLVTDGNAYAGPLPTAVVAGVIQSICTPFVPRGRPTNRFATMVVTTGAKLTVTASDVAVLNAQGTYVLAWVPDTTNPQTGAAWTYGDLLYHGYQEHAVSELVNGAEPPSVEMPPSAMSINDSIATDPTNWSTPSRQGYLILLANGLYPGSYLAVEVDLSGIVYGAKVQGSRKLVISQAAVDCATTCLANETRDSNMGVSYAAGSGKAPSTGQKAKAVAKSADWYGMVTAAGSQALSAAKNWALTAVRGYIPFL